MPTILIKRPFSPFMDLFSKNKVLSDLQQELGLNLSTVPIGSGYYLLVQTGNKLIDPVNVVHDGCAYHGTVYVIKASVNKILDITIDDLPYIIDSVDLNDEF